MGGEKLKTVSIGKYLKSFAKRGWLLAREEDQEKILVYLKWGDSSMFICWWEWCSWEKKIDNVGAKEQSCWSDILEIDWSREHSSMVTVGKTENISKDLLLRQCCGRNRWVLSSGYFSFHSEIGTWVSEWGREGRDGRLMRNNMVWNSQGGYWESEWSRDT